MVAIGRALMSDPKVLLLDEPSLGLAPILVDAIFEVIREINAKGTTILLIEQNALLALKTASARLRARDRERRALGPIRGADRVARYPTSLSGYVILSGRETDQTLVDVRGK